MKFRLIWPSNWLVKADDVADAIKNCDTVELSYYRDRLRSYYDDRRSEPGRNFLRLVGALRLSLKKTSMFILSMLMPLFVVTFTALMLAAEGRELSTQGLASVVAIVLMTLISIGFVLIETTKVAFFDYDDAKETRVTRKLLDYLLDIDFELERRACNESR